MLKKCIAALLCAVLFLPYLAGCGSKNNISSGAGAADYPVTVGSVTLRNPPSGAAVLSQNVADVILELGYEISLKAKSAACTQPDLAALPNVTADDAKKIKGLGADLVFADSPLTEAQQQAMKGAGISVLVLKPAAGRADLARLYSEVGEALKGAETGHDKGKESAQDMLETLDDITRVSKKGNTPITAAYLTDAQGGAATGDTFAGSLVEAAGLTNVADSGKDGKISAQSLAISNPAYLFCAKGVKAKLAASPQYQKLAAVKSGKVYEMDPNWMRLQGENMIEAVSFMAGTVHPELLRGTSSGQAEPTEAQSSAPASSSSLNLNQTLKKGMQNDDVLKMQNRLKELGYMFMKPTGLFGDGTEQSVKDFQLLNGLPATGIADPTTLRKMYVEDVKKRTD